MKLFSEITPTVPWNVSGSWLIGLIGAAAIFFFFIGGINQTRKLFGRKPPLDTELDHREENVRKDFAEADRLLTRRMDQIAEEFLNLTAKRERDWADLKDEIRNLSNDISFIRGKLEKPSHR